MNNICTLIILMILPSLSFAADQAPSIDVSRYSLTAKVLTTYFKTTPTTIKNTFQNCRFTKPDNAQITVNEVRPEDSVVNFNVKALANINCFAPGIRESLITTALVQALEKKIKENESWSSWLLRSQTNLPNNIDTEYWLDDGIAGKYNMPFPSTIICRGSISRELFDAINKMSHNSNLAVPTNESE